MEWSIKSIFCALLFLLFVFSVKTETPAVTPAKDKTIAYFIEILTEPEHFQDAGTKELTFHGKVTAQFSPAVTLPDSEFKIELNAQSKTEIKSLKLKDLELDKMIDKVKSEIKADKLVITCPKEASKVKVFQLEVEYTNPFGDDMTGFYRSSYKNDAGNTIWLLTTQFEPIFARKAFPCFDRPDLKALFKIHITVPKDIKTVLSNTAVESKKEETARDKVIFKFKPTEIPMSTYLVAFTASNLKPSETVKFKSEYLKEKYTDQRSLTTYGREEILKRREDALAQNIGKKALTKLTEYLGIGYAFEKVDQVGIPDFSAGAMENWGHISFREKSLFFNEKSSTASTHQANILTITHELVHQWFGNLVTLESWNYIWLNEAFANYIEYIIANMFEETKDWDLMRQLVVNEIHLRAFETDGLASSKPLNNKIDDEALIYSSFNDIPYSKGTAVLRMWNLQLPNNGFQESLKKYISDRKTLTGNPKQLFEAFKAKTKLDEENFNSWTTKAGYPVVEVKKNNGTYTLTQNRFFWDNKNDTSTWIIPITFFTNDSTKFDTINPLWLKNDPFSITLSSNPKWIIVNNEQAGYYRVNYDKENWNALCTALLEENHAKIPVLNRAQLINDAFSLARSLQKEYLDYKIPLTLIGYLRNESSFVAWKTALNSLDFLQTKLFGDKNYDKFKEYISSLIKPHFKTLKTENAKHIEKLMTVEISRWACRLDLDSCVKEAEGVYKNKTYDQFPDTKETVLCTVVRKNKNAWDEIFNKYKEESDSALKVMYISALGCTSEEKIVNKFLSDTLQDKSDIRKQDLSFVLSSVYNGNLKNVEAAFSFIEKNYKEIANKYGGINPLGKALVGIARKLKTDAQLKRLKTLTDSIKKLPELSSAAESVENAMNIATSNVKWIENKMKQIDKYLNSGSLLSYSFGLLVLSVISVFQF